MFELRRHNCFFRSILMLTVLGSMLAHAQETDEFDFGPTNKSPAPSTNGSGLLFISDFSGSDDVWIMRPTSSPELLLAWKSSNEREPDWLPEGNAFVFASDIDGDFNIWRADVDGQNPVRLTSQLSSQIHPRVSPDGTRIVYMSNESGKFEIWTMNVDGTDQRALALSSLRVSDPSWSPDGADIVYVGCTAASCNLYAFNASGFNQRQLTSGTAQDWNPDWGPQGIVFASDRDPDQKLWVIQSDGSGLGIFSNKLTGALFPRWTDDDRVVMSRADPQDASASMQLWTVDAFDNIQQLTDFAFVIPGDLDGDSDIDRDDIRLWNAGENANPQIPYSQRDVNGDGDVNGADLQALRNACTRVNCAVE